MAGKRQAIGCSIQRVVNPWSRLFLVSKSGCVRSLFAQKPKCRDASFARVSLIYIGLISNHNGSVSLLVDEARTSFEQLGYFVRNRTRARALGACCGTHRPDAVSIIV